MPTPVDPKRLPRLRAALKRVKAGEAWPQQDLAKLYGVTNARFTTLAHQRFESMPKPERRGDKTHWYDAAAAIGAMIAYCEGSGKSKRAAAARAAEIMTGSSSEAEAAIPAPAGDEPTALTPAEIDKLASAQTRLFRLHQEKGMFVRADLARGLIRTLFSTVQRSVQALPMEIDPNGELPPLHRARLESAVRDSMVRIHKTVADQLAEEETRAA